MILFVGVVVLGAGVAGATPVTLEEAREQGRRNVQVILSELEHERAQENVRLSRSAIYPRVTANGGVGGALFGPQRIFSTVPRGVESPSPTGGGFEQRAVEVPTSHRAAFDLNVSVSQLLYDGGRWWSQLAQSGALAEAEEGQLAEQRLASEFEAVRRFYELYRIQEARRLLLANVKRSEELVARAQALFEAGRAQRMDVYSAQVNLGNDRLELLRSEPRLLEAQAQLAVWLARSVIRDAPEAVPPAVLERPVVLQQPQWERVVARTADNRPLLRSIRARVRAAELEQSIARSDTLPRVAAQVTAGRQGPSADPFFTDPSRQNYVQGGLNVRWDLFTGFAHSAQTAQASLARRRAELEAEQLERELEAELRQAWSAIAVQAGAVEISKGNLEVAREAERLAQARYAAGAGSVIEVRDAQLKLTQAELAAVQVRIDLEIARAALERAMGGGVTE